MDPVAAARELVHERFPDARTAMLAGSVTTPRRTATSDLDIVVFLDGSPAPFRETTRHAGWVVELFVQTAASYEAFLEREVRQRRSPLLHMCDEGHLLLDLDSFGALIQDRAHCIVAAGPAPLTDLEREDRRYALTGQLDDLTGCTDDDELVYIGARILTSAAELALLHQCKWIGHGKWLLRRLRDAEPDLARHLVDGYRAVVAQRDKQPLEAAARLVLNRSGGAFQEGYRRRPQDLMAV